MSGFFGGGEGSRTPVRKPLRQTFYKLIGKYKFPHRRALSAGSRYVALKSSFDPPGRRSNAILPCFDARPGRTGIPGAGHAAVRQQLKRYYR